MPVYSYTTLNDPSATNGTIANGINASGQIVGFYASGSGVRIAHGFLLSGGAYTTFDDPLASQNPDGGTFAVGINTSSQIVGFYTTGGGTMSFTAHGFLLSGGTYTTLDDPSATNGSQLLGINASGQMVGQYVNASGAHGFILSGGTYTTLDDPSATKASTTRAKSWGTTITPAAPTAFS
jgi:uncharacterized membrane protein